MKRLALLGFALFLLPGCYLRTIHPHYFQKDLRFDKALLGTWTDEETTYSLKQSEGAWGRPAYQVTLKETEGNYQETWLAHLFELDGIRYLDCYPTPEDYEEDGSPVWVPVHIAFRVTQDQDSMKWVGLDVEWVEARKNSLKLGIVEIPGQDSFMATADTAKLREFLIKYGNHEDAWVNQYPVELTRLN